MSFEHPYPCYAYLERDPETNEKRWHSTKGMGVCYVHEDRVAEAIAAEREACAKLVHDRLGADGYGVAQMIRARSNSSK